MQAFCSRGLLSSHLDSGVRERKVLLISSALVAPPFSELSVSGVWVEVGCAAEVLLALVVSVGVVAGAEATEDD